MSRAERICILGAGLMGHGIAQVFAVQGYAVSVYDPSPQVLATLHERVRLNLTDLGMDGSCAELITPCTTIAEAVQDAGMVIEAALEDVSVKRALFAEVEILAAPDAILATNTSVIPVTTIMAGLSRRERALGTHWWNPPFLVPLVEVIATEWTSDSCIADAIDRLTAVGKTAVHIKKDVAGFVGNRLQHALWREAIFLVEQGICDAETVDTVVKASFGRRMGVLGPLENADLVGTDLTLAIHDIVLPSICADQSASPYLRRLVSEGRLGMKAGEGFRRWSPEHQAALRENVLTHLKNWGPSVQSEPGGLSE